MFDGLSSRALRLGVVAAAATALVASFGGPADAAPKKQKAGNDQRSVGANYNHGKPLRFSAKLSDSGSAQEGGAVVGTVRQWPALDDENGVIYTKRYRLRGVGNHIEIWVAENLAYPAGDCRNTIDGGAPITVTDAQVKGFIHQFDSNMYPKESEAFSVAPDRDGSNTKLKKLYSQFYGIPNRSYSGHGDRTVTLIDNVRDSNFYRPQDPDGKTYIGGFFYSVFNEMTNRNVMTIDSFDWKHRTGTFDSQHDDATNPEYVACGNAIGRAFGNKRGPDYEGTFAHEYQHLLEYYEDPAEVNWVNEGLSDWAQTLTGYVDPQTDPADPTADGHLASFLGFGGEAFGGPEQSMTRWEDQGPTEILADYGAAYSFMQYLWSHFGGDAFMSALHTEDAGGLVGLQKVLDDQVTNPPQALDVIHDWLASMALDAAIEDGSDAPTAADAAALSTDSMRAKINWASPQAYASPGAPTNGGDFVPLSAGPLSFTGHGSYDPAPVEWTTATDGRLYSGKGDNLDRAIVRTVNVPAGNATVSVGLQFDTEPTWDFAFVQVYDTSTKSWVSLESAGNTTSGADPGADPRVKANLPGLTGTGGPAVYNYTVPAAYTGHPVMLAVRYITDSSVDGEGVWLSSLKVGGVDEPGALDLSTWKSLTQAVPVPVESWTVQVVGYNAKHSGRAFMTLATQADGSMTGSIDPATALGFTPDTLGAIVTVNDSSETVADYGRYELKVGTVVQPGG
jgi:hypothetical protein